MKVMIFGAGRMGRRFIQIARNNNLEIGGICDLSTDALGTAKQEHHLSDSQLFTDAALMAHTVKADVSIVATTAPAHFEYSMLAIEANTRYLLCEKPMATSLTKCDQMISAAQAKGAVLGVNHQMRHIPEYQRMRELLHSPDFGGVNTVIVQSGNAGLAMNGLHFLEAFAYLTGSEIVEVTGWLRPEHVPNPRGAQFSDPGGAVRVQTRDGQSMYLEMDTRNGHGMKMMAAGPYGQFVMDLLEGTIASSVRKPENRSRVTGHYGTDSVLSTESFVPTDAITSSTIVLRELLKGANGNFVSGQAARHLIAVLVGAYISNEQGHMPVRFDSASMPTEREFAWA